MSEAAEMNEQNEQATEGVENLLPTDAGGLVEDSPAPPDSPTANALPDTTDAPETALPVEQAKKLPGRAVTIGPEAIGGEPPHNTGQLFTCLEGDAEIAGILVDDGCEIVRVIAGRFNYPLHDDLASKWEDILGKRLTKGAYVTVVVRNTTGSTMAASGALYLTGETNPPKSKAAPVRTSSVARSAPFARPAAPAPVRSSREKKSVTPGTNEVAILMKRGDCERLVGLVKNGFQLHAGDQPAILLSLERALKP